MKEVMTQCISQVEFKNLSNFAFLRFCFFCDKKMSAASLINIHGPPYIRMTDKQKFASFR